MEMYNLYVNNSVFRGEHAHVHEERRGEGCWEGEACGAGWMADFQKTGCIKKKLAVLI